MHASSPSPPASSTHLLRTRLGKVCVAIAASNPSEMIEKASETVRENPFLEFRLDYLPNPLAALPKLKQFLYERSEVTAIATCRRAANGGSFKGTIAAQLEILEKAATAGAHILDLEIQTAEAIKSAQLQQLRTHGAALLLSHHDFAATKDLDATFARIQRFHPELVKIVSTAKTLADNLQMMHFLERTRDTASVIGICMGDPGALSRVLGIRAGSVFTFGAASVGEETGPGQIAARTLRETFRIESIDASTRVYGVAGNPITHSLSPLMLNTAFRRENVNAVFLPLQTAKLTDLLKLIREVPLHGLAVTMPLKQEIMPHLENTDPLSRKIGACNTVVRSQDAKLYGFNTDVAAVVRPLEKRLSLKGARILVLGAGGAARAAVFGLKDKGADVFLLNRTADTAQKLARQAKAKVFRRDQLAKSSFDVILNATPVGMHGAKPQPPLLAPNELNARLVFDMVYNPIETPLLAMARQKGLPVITGVEMFVHQGARQFEIWSAKPAPEDEMLRVVLHALRQRPENQLTARAGADLKPARLGVRPSAPAPVPAKPSTPAATPAPPASSRPALARARTAPPPAKQTPAPAKPAIKAGINAVKAPAKTAKKSAPKPSPKPAPKPATKSPKKSAKSTPARSRR